MSRTANVRHQSPQASQPAQAKAADKSALSNSGPIFIIGTGRSGTTLLYEWLANHPDLAWISNLTNHWPQLPQLAWFSNLTNYSMRGNQLRKRKYMPRPAEGYGAWNFCVPHFGRPPHPLDEADVTESSRQRLRGMAAAHMRWQRKLRFLGKWTGWSRIGFMSSIFPDARFIHVMRDGRAVARSLTRVPWWDGWHGPDQWRWGRLSPELQALWDQSDRSYLVLAGIQWKILVNEITAAAQKLPPEHYLEIRYEDLVADPHAILSKTLDYCSLPSSRRLTDTISSAFLDDMNRKWQSELSEEQRRCLTEGLLPDLRRLGYE